MATFVVCTRCGKTLEVAAIDAVPTDWRRTITELLCPRCTDEGDEGEDGLISDVLDEEVIYPPDGGEIDDVEDTFDEGYCEVCDGPCQGH